MSKLYIVQILDDGRLYRRWSRYSEKAAREVMSDNCTYGDYRVTIDNDNVKIYEAGR